MVESLVTVNSQDITRSQVMEVVTTEFSVFQGSQEIMASRVWQQTTNHLLPGTGQPG
jgi:hypothetical protein